MTNELSKQMRQERFYITDSVSRVNATLDMYADKVELMEAVIYEQNKLLDTFRRKLDELEQETLPAAHYQIKRAIAQLDPTTDECLLCIVDSVKAQLEAYLKGE